MSTADVHVENHGSIFSEDGHCDNEHDKAGKRELAH
jgi:hypothetical protein